MAILPIYTYGTGVLRQKAQPVKTVTDEIIKLIVDMFETMRNASGIGLAANQVGSLYRIIVVDVSDVEEFHDIKPMAMINPEVVSRSGIWTAEEGCLSIPDVRDEVDRDETLVVRYKNTTFQTIEIETHGLLSRVILHEIDHLNGVLFLDRCPAEKRELHTDDLKMIEQGEMDVSYPVVTAVDVPV